MEDKKMNETESLELIAQMIQNTRHRLDTGSGNMFLVWGYVAMLVTLVTWAGVYFTKNPEWMWGFWGIPVIGYPLTLILLRKQKQPVKMYGDKVLSEMWQILGLFCMAVVIGATFTKSFALILPLCTLLMSLGSVFTGCIIRYTVFSGLPSFGAALGLDMLFDVWDKVPSHLILLEFALAIVLAMIIPGHILNYKARRERANRK